MQTTDIIMATLCPIQISSYFYKSTNINSTHRMTDQTDFDANLWAFYLLQQEQLCNRLGVAHVPTDPYQIIGMAADTALIPTHGLRHPVGQHTAGWYIWSGEYSPAEDFFKPTHAYHLLTSKPELIKYLGLPAGYRFLIDDQGYEDVWFDSLLLDVS